MFRNIIRSTSMTSDTANGFFSNIYGDHYHSDVSFVSTLRALVAPRMTPEDIISLRYKSTSMTNGHIVGVPTESALHRLCGELNYIGSGVIIIHSFDSSNPEDNEACMALIKSSFISHNEGWHELEKMYEFYHNTFNVRCFINPELRNVYIFTESMDVRKWHYLQCSIFAFLPWYFDPEKGVSELEMELIKSLREKSPDKYTSCINRIAETYDFRTAKIKELLKGFELRYEKIERDRTKSDINNRRNEIHNLNNQISDKLTLLRDLEIKLLGLETKLESGDESSEIMEYFIRNKRLSLERVSDTEMTFTIKDYLSYYDEDMARNAIDNPRSFVYNHSSVTYASKIPADDMKKLMNYIFVSNELKIRFCAAYRFRLNGTVQALQNHSAFLGSEYNEYMPNIHIDAFACIGNYNVPINNFLEKHDYIGAIEQCIASCKSLNFADSTVMKQFMYELYGFGARNSKCIELPDGSVVDAKDAIKWIKNQEEKNNG